MAIVEQKVNSIISLFSGAGIGDKGLEASGFQFILHNEKEAKRTSLIKRNFPDSYVIEGDILQLEKDVISIAKTQLQEDELLAIVATPPCQGMSQNGLGTLLNNIRQGKRPQLDIRNRLILPVLRITEKLRPKWLIIENVPQMETTMIEDDDGELIKILDVINKYLGHEYQGEYKIIEFADYGVPQRRKRLISVYSRLDFAKTMLKKGYSFIPHVTHDKLGRNGLKKWVTVRDAISHFPSLDSFSKETAFNPNISLHYVPVLDSKKYNWLSHTPPNESAFNNQCINPECKFQDNPNHGTMRDNFGINRAKKTTPLYCIKCGSLLPRPYTVNNDKTLRIMKGYTSAYKRMDWDLPASTLTKNFSYPCSDNKIHPEQNRVLSLAEACQLQTISDFEYYWGEVIINGQKYSQANDTTIKDAIGESIPPLFMYKLGKHILEITYQKIVKLSQYKQLELISL